MINLEPIFTGFVYSSILRFFIELIKFDERLLESTHPILPPTFELSDIPYKFAVFSKPISIILENDRFYCVFVSFIFFNNKYDF